MSLFDVIRYPISDRPTAEELGSLPHNLFEEWRNKSFWGLKSGRLNNTTTQQALVSGTQLLN
jgi:hypothetical protein